MKIRLVAVGTRMPAWVEQGYLEYARRLPPECCLQLKEISAQKRGRQQNTQQILDAEGQSILKALLPADYVVALDVVGHAWSTEELAQKLQLWMSMGSNVALLVGGPEGLAPECLARARERWSLSPLTLPHPLVRVVLAEALYRAWSLLSHHPYHRG